MLAHSDIRQSALDSTTPPAAKAGKKRWLIVLAAAVLLHVLTLDWANRNIAVLPPEEMPKPAIAMVQLKAPAPAVVPDAALVKFKPKPKALHHVAETPQQSPPPEAVTPVEPDPVVATSDAPSTLTPSDTKDQQAEPTSAPSAPEETAKTEEKSGPQYKVELPPSALLNYDFQMVKANGNEINGSGEIDWSLTDGKYRETGKASKLAFPVFTFSSEGKVDAYGLAPNTYNEKAAFQSEIATHFNRDDRNSISFSATSKSFPLKGGEQDRASFIWELAGIGRGDREKFIPGAQIDLFVAETRDADIWSILVVGMEDLQLGEEKIQAWHVTRVPRPGSYDSRFDIWLAPQKEWYPVKIRKTEKNGNYYELTMKSIRARSAASAQQDITR